MKHVICSIYDSATEAYMRPFTAQSEGQALRMFEDEARRPDSDIGRHPQDYALFIIGKFDDHNAELTNEIKCLRRAHEIPRTPDTDQEALFE